MFQTNLILFWQWRPVHSFRLYCWLSLQFWLINFESNYPLKRLTIFLKLTKVTTIFNYMLMNLMYLNLLVKIIYVFLVMQLMQFQVLVKIHFWRKLKLVVLIHQILGYWTTMFWRMIVNYITVVMLLHFILLLMLPHTQVMKVETSVMK